LASQFEEHPTLRELLLVTESFDGTGEIQMFLQELQTHFRKLNKGEPLQFDLYEDEIIEDDIAVVSERREKARKKRNIWKDRAGGSILEINSGSTVGLVGDNEVTIPISALTNNAKYVVKKYQFEKRHYSNEGDDQYSDDEEELSNQRKNISLFDFIPEKDKLLEMKEKSPIEKLDDIDSRLDKLKSLPKDSLTSNLTQSIVKECQSLQCEVTILSEVLLQGEQINVDSAMEKLFRIGEDINTILKQYEK